MIDRIPEEIKYVIDSIRNAGHDAFLVGGCVRDFIMGLAPKDFDVTTDATPAQVHEIFEGSKDTLDPPHLIDTGIKQGTVTVIKNHVPVEVTTYRRESNYSDGRHPGNRIAGRHFQKKLGRPVCGLGYIREVQGYDL